MEPSGQLPSRIWQVPRLTTDSDLRQIARAGTAEVGLGLRLEAALRRVTVAVRRTLTEPPIWTAVQSWSGRPVTVHMWVICAVCEVRSGG